MDGARRTASSNEWRRTGLPDHRLIGAVYAVLGELRLATDAAALALPVGFGDVPPLADVVDLGGSYDDLDHVLRVEAGPQSPADGPGRALTAAVHRHQRISDTILIAHGDLVLGDIEDSVVIATGAVEASSTLRCAVFAGHQITVGTDSGSLLVAGSRLSITMPGSRVKFSLLGGNTRPTQSKLAVHAAPEYQAKGPVSPGATVVAVNVARHDGAWNPKIRRVDWPSLDLADEGRGGNDPLAGNVAFLALSTPHSYHGAVQIRVRGLPGSVKVVGSGPIVDRQGRPVHGLEGWTVYRIEKDHTMICNGDRLLRVDHWKSQADPFAATARSGSRGFGS
jgi:hypothetical protein